MTTESAHDPVCHMDIDPSTAAGSSEYEGDTYYFCSRGCMLDFEDDPSGVLKAEADYDHRQPVQHMTASKIAKKPWWKFWA